MYNELNLDRAAAALEEDVTVDEQAVDSPTSIPCGITISITLNC